MLTFIVIFNTANLNSAPLLIVIRSEEIKMQNRRNYQPSDIITKSYYTQSGFSPVVSIQKLAAEPTLQVKVDENLSSVQKSDHYQSAMLIKTDAPTKSTLQHEVEQVDPVQTKLSFHRAVNDVHKHVLPRAAYFDRRKREKHANSTVILAHISKTIIEKNLIVSCVVDGQHAKSLKVQKMRLNEWIHLNHPECTHDNIIIFCYDTPASKNCKVALVYKNPHNHTEHVEVESEYSMYMPYSINETMQDSPTSGVMVCTTVYDSPPYFIEWLHYQRALGVDLVYINAQESFTMSRLFNDTFFQQLLSTGFVQMKVWSEYLSEKQVYYHSQALYYQHCLYHFQGVYKYAVMSDTDDFLIPSGADMTSISLLQHLHNIFDLKEHLQVGSIRLRWIRYYEPICGVNLTGIQTHSPDGNLTKYVNMSSAMLERNFKSVHKISATVETKVHEVAELMPGYSWCIVPDNLLYMAHIKQPRFTTRQKQAMQACHKVSSKYTGS